MGFGAFGSCCSVCPPLPFPFPSVGKEIGVGRSALRNSRPSSQPLSYPRSLYNGMQTARDWNKNRCGYICILKRSFQRLTDGACLVENELQGSHICPMIVTILKAEKAEKKNGCRERNRTWAPRVINPTSFRLRHFYRSSLNLERRVWARKTRHKSHAPFRLTTTIVNAKLSPCEIKWRRVKVKAAVIKSTNCVRVKVRSRKESSNSDHNQRIAASHSTLRS